MMKQILENHDSGRTHVFSIVRIKRNIFTSDCDLFSTNPDPFLSPSLTSAQECQTENDIKGA